MSYGNLITVDGFLEPETIEFDIRSYVEFTKTHGMKVRRAGGKYTECRGMNHLGRRRVTLPLAARALATDIIARYRGTNPKTDTPRRVWMQFEWGRSISGVRASFEIGAIADPIGKGLEALRIAWEAARANGSLKVYESRQEEQQRNAREDAARQANVDLLKATTEAAGGTFDGEGFRGPWGGAVYVATVGGWSLLFTASQDGVTCNGIQPAGLKEWVQPKLSVETVTELLHKLGA